MLAISQQTGLGASFVGVALVAASTSLPELSTALAAVRRGNHQLAVSNILGTNCTGMVVTAIYLLGLLERRDRTILRKGSGSFAVLMAYSVGLAASTTSVDGLS